MFSPQKEFMYFILISEQKAIIFVYGIKTCFFFFYSGRTVFTVRYGVTLLIQFKLAKVIKVLPWLRQLIGVFSPWILLFDRRSGCVSNKVTLGYVFFGILRVSLLILFHQCFTLTTIHMFLLPEEQKRETWKLHEMQCSFSN